MANEISREALISYLENLRTLETARHISQERFKKLEQKKNSLVFRDNPPREPEEKGSEWITIILGAIVIGVIVGLFLGIFGAVLLFILQFFVKFPDWLDVETFQVILFSGSVGVSIIIAIISETTSKNKYEKAFKQYTADLEDYERRKAQELSRIQEEKSKIESLQQEIQNEVNKISATLEKAYSINIIPKQFRDIYGIYYLYDYLSTSNESLSSALMQANLEAIKQKLDQMIQLQSEMLIEQRQANREQFQYHQQMLESARRTEQNSYVASQYAEISALNSETSLMMQREQLAYQKADYYAKTLGLY